MRLFAVVLAAGVLLAAPAAFSQTDPAATATTPTAPDTNSTPSAGDTTAATPATPDATQQQGAGEADHHVTCHTVVSVESRLRRNRQRICGTRQQWEQMQDQNARDTRQMGTVQGRSGR